MFITQIFIPCSIGKKMCNYIVNASHVYLIGTMHITIKLNQRT